MSENNTKFDCTVVIPTFNEEATISYAIEKIDKIMSDAKINTEILIIDDDSTDRTPSTVRELAKYSKNIRYEVRKGDKDLARSLIDGFSISRSDILLTTDADLSHDVQNLPQMYKLIKDGNDIVIASRYIGGGKILNWPLSRRIISYGSNTASRVLFPYVSDTGNFFAIKKSVVDGIWFPTRGYKLILDVVDRGNWKTIKNIPFTFKEREQGESKIDLKVVIKFLTQLAYISFHACRHRDTRAWEEIKKILKFTTVGGIGILVNLGVLYSLTEFTGLYYLLSGIIATEISILNNFLWNDLWTFKETDKSMSIWGRLSSYHMISFGGAIINLAVLYGLTSMGLYYMLSQVAGIFLAFAWNIIMNRRHTWVKF